MKKAIIYLFFILVFTLCTGFYLRYYSGDILTGDRFIGITILTAVFVLMPMFLYHRWKNRKVKDYMLTEDNINKMREFSKRKERNRK